MIFTAATFRQCWTAVDRCDCTALSAEVAVLRQPELVATDGSKAGTIKKMKTTKWFERLAAQLSGANLIVQFTEDSGAALRTCYTIISIQTDNTSWSLFLNLYTG